MKTEFLSSNMADGHCIGWLDSWLCHCKQISSLDVQVKYILLGGGAERSGILLQKVTKPSEMTDEDSRIKVFFSDGSLVSHIRVDFQRQQDGRKGRITSS